MKQDVVLPELEEHWHLTNDELSLMAGRKRSNDFWFSLVLKFFQKEGYFPIKLEEFPEFVIAYVVSQLGFDSSTYYTWRRCRSWISGRF